MNKRGLSTVVATVLIILLVIVAIIILWIYFGGFLRENKETAEIKSELLGEEIKIDNFNGGSSNVKLTITRETTSKTYAEINTTNETRTITVTIVPELDVYLSTDLSSSMSDCLRSQLNCCNRGNNYCSGNEALCSSCSGTWSPKISEVKQANKDFIDILLNYSGKRVGLAGYNWQVAPENYLSLSNNKPALKQKVDDFILNGGTCICCGIINATEELKYYDDNKKKFILVMSDGHADKVCPSLGDVGDLDGRGGPNDSNDYAIKASCIAHELYNITVDTIAFGVTDSSTLQQIAVCGGGTFRSSDNSAQLKEDYRKAAENLTSINYTQEVVEGVVKTSTKDRIDYIKVVFHNATISYTYKITDLPRPLEKKTYTINVGTNITNITKVEAYPVKLTKSGQEIIGPLGSVWTSAG